MNPNHTAIVKYVGKDKDNRYNHYFRVYGGKSTAACGSYSPSQIATELRGKLVRGKLYLAKYHPSSSCSLWYIVDLS